MFPSIMAEPHMLAGEEKRGILDGQREREKPLVNTSISAPSEVMLRAGATTTHTHTHKGTHAKIHTKF